ncbi:Ribonuclease T2-like protein [Yarrowia sp. E02]|nr:Ribonuclease T2-like protein [Yarrowia sp. E02]
MQFSLATIATVAAAVSALVCPYTKREAVAAFTSPPLSSADHKSCPADTPVSCSSGAGSADLCCTESPGGVLVLTQFWDWTPAIGPDDLFTLHGLWPDNCDGSYAQFCDKSMEVQSVAAVLQQLGETELLDKMNKIWIPNRGSTDSFWTHEWNKHATCMSTLKDKCYSSDAPQYQSLADWAHTVVNVFETVNTYKFLEAAGITPDSSKTYAKTDFLNALNSNFDGKKVHISCKSGYISEIWYYFHLKGSVVSGQYLPIDDLGSSSCPDQIKYPPKASGTTPPPTNPSDPADPPTGGSKGFINISGQPGCLISSGNWYASGTCATYTLGESQYGGVTLTSSKGPCDVVNGKFSCASGNNAGQFTQDGSNIVYGGKSDWSAPSVPSGSQQVGVSPGSAGGPVSFNLVFAAK